MKINHKTKLPNVSCKRMHYYKSSDGGTNGIIFIEYIHLFTFEL